MGRAAWCSHAEQTPHAALVVSVARLSPSTSCMCQLLNTPRQHCSLLSLARLTDQSCPAPSVYSDTPEKTATELICSTDDLNCPQTPQHQTHPQGSLHRLYLALICFKQCYSQYHVAGIPADHLLNL